MIRPLTVLSGHTLSSLHWQRRCLGLNAHYPATMLHKNGFTAISEGSAVSSVVGQTEIIGLLLLG
jgi:hypothetical protein